MDAKQEANKLREEAKRHLEKMFDIPEGISSGSVACIVDCIIGAAVLEAAILIQRVVDEADVEEVAVGEYQRKRRITLNSKSSDTG